MMLKKDPRCCGSKAHKYSCLLDPHRTLDPHQKSISDLLSTPPFVIKLTIREIFLSLFVITPTIYWTIAYDTQDFQWE
ncbi:hypothetical protein RHMOL_Rhmol05G0029500 [Rhododendron molle]|uniref:Uncharacterized protein n=1 Tax=Rhododendron molle TaxID=49168 RepID=A0ACC0NLD1_RHOML|nr:hypothetical protein RHMOL_Rhmol05G0029500 [Rhododendron molle]